uniref:CUB domain-containing protein n=1 Tax=Arion vulgaris TaxID=1028688 RepID=A0A0B7BPM5_9EUPU
MLFSHAQEQLLLTSFCSYLQVYEGVPAGRSLGTLCGSSIPSPITTVSNRMWLTYRTDVFLSGRGFRAQYHANCNNRLTGNSGVIESPNFPNPYFHNTNCTWTIEAPIGNKINVSFAVFNLEGSRGCFYDRLQIRDAQNAQSRQMITLCGNDIPDNIQSNSSQLWINFLSDASIANEGFRLEWIVDGCGGNIYGSSGVITSPNYPNHYPSQRECQWLITVDTGNMIEMTITNFDLESSSNCYWDALEVYAGSDKQGSQIAQLCHRQVSAQTLHTTGSTAFIVFRSDSSVSGTGFRLTYRALSGGCGGNFTARTATITSINYPNNYEHNTECEWNITVAQGYVVVLNITDFQLEGGHLCTYDYLSLYDGSDVNATLITKLCGATLPAQTVYRSTGNQMYIRMRTDSSVTYRGFKATYDTGCGGTRNADIDGELISPTYLGSNWSPFCIWIISSDFNNRRISLTFTHMDLNSNCSYEYVAVNDGRESVINETSVPQNAYCGNSVPATITSEGSALNVVSKNSRSRHRPNFRAVYSSAYSSCGGEFTSDRGTFTSPSFPDGYPVNIECVWLIKTSPGNSVQLSFPNFQLDPLGGINDDYLEIRSPNVSGAILGRWFGTTAPANLTSLSNVWVKFRSNEDTTAPGFKAVYSNSFGGNLFGDSGQVASPRYPLFYPANSNYRWTILASQNKRIRVSFSGLSIELESDISSCIYDYVQIFDGTEQDGVSLGRFCGSTLPSPVYSINNLITVVFSSDSYRQDSGFLMDWLAVPPEDVPTPAPSVIPATPIPGCGGQLVASETQQNLTSPGYPSVYEHNLDCSWTISVPVGNTIIVNIISIDMEGSGGCYYDYLRLSNGGLSPFRPRFNSNFRSTFCGRTGAGTIIQSVGNTMIVTFHTDHSISMSGFVLTYEIGCGGFSTLATGVISSTNYPSNYKANQNCTWSTQVQPGRTIRLEFENQFNIADTGVCNDDYLLLLNGGTVQSPPLFVNGTTNTNGRYCGSSKPQVMETSSNFLVAQFISDATNEDIGFSFTYSTVSVACGGQLRLTHAVRSGNFTSPNYPGDYPHNVDCVWVIIAPASQRVRVDFEETFGIEAHPGCRFDFVEFRDGGTTNSQRIGNALCGNSLPGTVLSTGNILLARFRTDSSVPHTGFKAKYSIATCGGRIIADRGVLTSPNYPGRYSNNADCEWSIVGPVGHFLTINITDSRLQYTINCTADSLVIRDGNSTDNILFQFCEHLTLQSVLTSDNTAYIRFRSDGSVTDQGFRIVFQASVEECGGQRNTPTGIIQSPNYPGHYAHRRLCVWEITVPIARRVTLTFNDIQIEGYSGGRCSWDSVQVYNGYIQQSPTIGRYCNVNPGTIESSGNTMRVQFQTDGRGSSGRGFQATYTSDREAECGGYIVESPGNITSPGFENATYNHNVQCLWNLQNRLANSSIRLQFTNMSLEENPSCWFDYVEIREGTNINGEFIGRFCGHVVPVAPIILSASEVWIRFRSDISISHIGFNLLYEFTECGGIITEPQGVITSPNYPNNYVSNTVACAWKIVAPEGTKIRVNFTDFNFETNTGCDSDNLQLQNGGLSDSPVIGKYCGTDLPSSFLSQSNKLRLTLQSNLTSRARRFRIVYSFDSGGCGGLLHSNQGSLSSPNYPSSYPHNVECTWDINVPVGFMINLRFNPPFDLEARDCVNDYVEVFDTFYNGSLISLGRWCQNIEPPNQRSTSNRLVVVFRSDATTNGNGFSASWDVACGGVFTNPTGVVLSPHYPSPYPNNLICHYTIGPGPDHHVLLRFTDFELEGRPSTCSYDYVQILQGATTVDYMQWPYYYRSYRHRYCGTDSPGVLLSSGQIILQFNTDNSLQYKGFRAEYTSEECGGVFTDPSGTFSTPHHPNNYMNNMNCSWNITVASNRIIKFKFQTFETERHHSCMYDYISFYDGSDTNSSMIGRYCGNMQNVPEFIRSTGNHMYITFITDFSFTLGGFSGTYETTYGPQQGCGGALRQSSGTFTSVDGDSDGLYESNLHCEWWIFVNDNKVVSLTITGLDIEASQDCSRDSLKVYDGLNKDDPLLGTFCGRTLPQQPIWASSNVIFVVFETDDLISGRGFNASFTENNALCGGAYNATTNPVTISSPNYPNSTGTAVHCSWIIDTGDSSKQVRLIVSDFQLQVSSNCVDEHLTFRDRPLGNNGQELTYCGNTIPPHFDSKGAQVKIIYFLSTTSTSRGFQLSYQIADCNRNITLPNGRITSPGYPGVYQRNSDCTILVTSPENTTLSFYFKFFEMERHPNCNWDYLEIKNSMSTTVSKECGYTIPSPVFLSDNVATLRFKTDSSIQHPGYDVTFMSSTQGSGCGGNMTGLTAGAFTSPGYPNSYMESSTCTWNLTPPARRPILWRISFMNTPDGAGGNCDTDYLTIYLGSTTAAPLLQRFCGLPEPSSNQVVVEQPLLIQYVSTGNGTAPVFRFEFDTNPQTFNATRTINRQIYPYF